MWTNILVDRAFKMTDGIYHQISDFSLNMQVKSGNHVGRNCVVQCVRCAMLSTFGPFSQEESITL